MNETEKLQKEIERLKVSVAIIQNEWQSERYYFQELEKSFKQIISDLPNYNMAVKIVKTELDAVVFDRNEQLRTELIEVVELAINEKTEIKIKKINQIIEQLPDKLYETKKEIFKHLENLKTIACAVKIADLELQKFFEDNYYTDYR